MSLGTEGLERRSIIDLSNDEARAFLLKHESYSPFELPLYFTFEGLLDEIAQQLKRNFSFKKRCNAANQLEKVNYMILNNKDGRYSWRPYELFHPILYVSLVDQMTRKDAWQEIITRFEVFASNPHIECITHVTQ